MRRSPSPKPWSVEKNCCQGTQADRAALRILTAGSFDDNVDPFVFGSYVRKRSQHAGLGELPANCRAIASW